MNSKNHAARQFVIDSLSALDDVSEMYFRSVNEIICHGIPDLRPLQDGDILNSERRENSSTLLRLLLRSLSVDISVYKHGFHSDLNETLFIGNVDQPSRDLVRTAYGCLEKAMEMSKSPIDLRSKSVCPLRCSSSWNEVS